jgi:hypothetical protein
VFHDLRARLGKGVEADSKQFSASMWSSEEAAQIRSIAKAVNPEIKTHAIPQGLHNRGGPDAIVEYLTHEIPLLLG